MTADPSDPNELAGAPFFPGVPGPDAAFQQRSVLTKFGTRWFLWWAQAAFYTDDSTGLTDWLRCPLDFNEGSSTTPPIISGIVQVSSTLIAVQNRNLGNCIAISTDNGETWTSGRGPLALYDTPTAVAALGSEVFVYFYTGGNTLSVAHAASPFSSWTIDLLVAPSGINLGALKNTSTGLMTSTSSGALLYSADGITFVPATIA